MGVTKGVAAGVIVLLTNWAFPFLLGSHFVLFPHLCLYHLREGLHKIDLVLHSTGHFGDQVTSWGCDGGGMMLGLHCRGILHSDSLGVPSAAGDWMMRV